MIKVIDTKTKDSDYCAAYMRANREDRYLIVVAATTDVDRYNSKKVWQHVEEIEKFKKQVEDNKSVIFVSDREGLPCIYQVSLE